MTIRTARAVFAAPQTDRPKLASVNALVEEVIRLRKIVEQLQQSAHDDIAELDRRATAHGI